MSRYVVTGGPWQSRIGKEAVIVPPPPGPAVYPWHGLGKSEVVIFIENDAYATNHDWGWTCVLKRSDLSPVVEATP